MAAAAARYGDLVHQAKRWFGTAKGRNSRVILGSGSKSKPTSDGSKHTGDEDDDDEDDGHDDEGDAS